MEVTSGMVDISVLYTKECEYCYDLQELYNPDRFSFLMSPSPMILFPDFDRSVHEYRSYEKNVRCHVFTSIDEEEDEYWTAVWIPTPGELFDLLKEALTKTRKGKNTTNYTVTRAVERHAYECNSEYSMSMVMLSLLQKTWKPRLESKGEMK